MRDVGQQRILLLMTTVPLDDYQNELCAGGQSYFFLACVRELGFLVTDHGYTMNFIQGNRTEVAVSFKEDILTEYFEVRVSCDDWDLPWCDVRRVAGLRCNIMMRLHDACDLVGLPYQEDSIPDGMLHELATQKRIHDYATYIRLGLPVLRNIPLPTPN